MNSIFVLSILVYFLQGIKGITSQPLLFYLKENLGLSASFVMLIGSITSVFWFVKPIYGIIIDRFPIFGYRYKGYILLSLIVSLISTLFLGIFSLPLVGIVLFSMVDSLSSAVRDVAVDGLSVSYGKETDTNDKLQTLQWGSLTIAGIITGIVGGYISEYWNYKIAFLVLSVFYIPLLWIVLKMKEPVEKSNNNSFLKGIINSVLKDKRFLLGALFLFCLWFSPAIGTPIMYKIRDDLHFSRFVIGLLGSFGSLMAVIGSVIFWKINKKINFIYLLYGTVILSAISTFAYLCLTPILVWIYTIVFGITGMITHLTLMTFMANITPKNYESTTFALLCSIVNFGSFCSSLVGSFLYKFFGYNWLVIISGLFTLLCLGFIPFLEGKNE